ncbi:MAG TPA: TlpA disulfide reductase family protein [Planctomycetota bacterium]|jgi:thiol-disulfide isomerase/thioredoxin|nr:TlpA disulfide reductase family protein [Planctomycetota bacterium]
MLLALAIGLLIQGRDGDYGMGYAEIGPPTEMLEVGAWRAWLESPGGELPFEIVIARDGPKLSAKIRNGEEEIGVPETRLEGDQIVFDIPHYDSSITAKVARLGTKLDGEWKNRSGADRWTKLKFHATAGAAPRFRSEGPLNAAPVAGRWSAKFDGDADLAVAILRPGADGAVEGTFLTSTGDFRWLTGSCERGHLRLSCFDGAHAFLFDARTSPDGSLAGDFWSGDRGHDTWMALRDDHASIPDEFERAHWKDGFGLAQLRFPDLDGKEHSLGEEAFAGRAIVVQVLGSWCPNCHDETAYLARVYDQYKARGLSVVGLAFEMTGDFARDAEQVRRMRERHKVAYPMLLAGLADNQKAAEALPALDRVIAFPTTIFLHRDGRVRAVHSGFAGPATKEEHAKLAKQFERIIEELLAEPDAAGPK